MPKKIEKRLGYPIVKIIEKEKDFDDRIDIGLVLYQKFIRLKSIGRIAKFINNHYTTIIVDECHDSGAAAYLKFISRLNLRYRMGLSATPKRKDSRDRLIYEYIGPTVAESNVVAMVPKVELLETGVYSKYNHRLWVYAMKFLAKNKDRRNLIVREVFADLRAGHKGIIIPVDFVDQGRELVKLINRKGK